MTIEYLDPQPVDVTVSVNWVTTHRRTDKTEASTDDDGNLILTNMLEVATGEVKSMRLEGIWRVGDHTPRVPMNVNMTLSISYQGEGP